MADIFRHLNMGPLKSMKGSRYSYLDSFKNLSNILESLLSIPLLPITKTAAVQYCMY